MPTLTMTKGLPASGKTSWAKEQSRLSPTTCVLVDKDSLRSLLHNGKFSKGNEKQVLAVRDAIVRDSLTRGRNVIVHDTNLLPKHAEDLWLIADELGAIFQVKDFTDVPLDECLRRDAERAHPVGGKVIRDMWRKHLYVAPTPPAHIPGAPDVIICDLDGTLAIMCDRSPYDATGKCIGDTLNEHVARLIAFEHSQGTGIILMSGRESTVRGPTIDWLRKNAIHWDDLIMRPEGDHRKDSIVKRELYEGHIAGRYNVLYVVDDRPQVLRMWSDELGLFTFDVNQSGEDF